MTDKKQLKARIRARMAKTGESYTAARRHVVGATAEPRDGDWVFTGGRHPDSAVVAALTGLSEPLVFLAGGGIGAGYILWEFKRHDSVHLTLGFRHQWQYPGRWMAQTLDRLGVPYEHHTTAGAKGAARKLAEELDAGHPCVVLPDRYTVGYWHLPPYLDGHGGHPVIAYRRSGGMVHLDDRGTAPILVPQDRLDAARARVTSYKNSLFVIRPAGQPADPAPAVREGLRACVEALSSPSDSFSLPAWRKWSRMMTDERNAKGWPRVFAGGRGLAGALLSLWEGVEPVGMDGGNLRDLFADGLDQAAELLDTGELKGVAEEFRRVHGLWHELAETALPASRYGRIRELTAAVRESLLSEGTASEADAAELWRLRQEAGKEPQQADLEAMGRLLMGIYEAESAAMARLGEIV
ncbi:BtrH N-terminal domain-containing protein [Thermoactinospora rubra]|uniref:BtrH N-terminal domain-containing protein n=1 Tax=Thermoactinospora rubra TaxID=1088767 RepID=UPI001980786C|nr:BtrH N-terminal domain-containing protein [Thermoactinospora rubra]